MTNLDTLIADLQEEARKHRHAADILDARIQGLQEARKFLPADSNGVEPPRKTRRNIRKMVAELHAAEPDLTIELMAQRIGCRAAQVREAAAAMRADE